MQNGLPFITAHAGCEGTPANSMESVEFALQKGADFIEVDVRATAAGRLVLSHDKRTEEEYKSCVPLAQVLKWMQENPEVGINCDLKEKQQALPLVALAEEYGIAQERLILTGSVGPQQLAAEPAIWQKSRVFINIEELLIEALPSDLVFEECDRENPWMLLRALAINPKDYAQAMIERLKEMRLAGVNMPYSANMHPLFDLLLAADIPISLWTIDDPETQRLLLKQKVANITTRALLSALEIRRQELCLH